SVPCFCGRRAVGRSKPISSRSWSKINTQRGPAMSLPAGGFMNSEQKLDKLGIAHIFDHLIQEELRIIGAYNLVMARLHGTPASSRIENIQKHHTQVVSTLC